MANDPDYKCDECGKQSTRKDLTVKKAVFLEMGNSANTLRTRVTAWLCVECLRKDEDWNRPRYQPKPKPKKINAGSR